jgi:hypothetical protein
MGFEAYTLSGDLLALAVALELALALGTAEALILERAASEVDIVMEADADKLKADVALVDMVAACSADEVAFAATAGHEPVDPTCTLLSARKNPRPSPAIAPTTSAARMIDRAARRRQLLKLSFRAVLMEPSRDIWWLPKGFDGTFPLTRCRAPRIMWKRRCGV